MGHPMRWSLKNLQIINFQHRHIVLLIQNPNKTKITEVHFTGNCVSVCLLQKCMFNWMCYLLFDGFFCTAWLCKTTSISYRTWLFLQQWVLYLYISLGPNKTTRQPQSTPYKILLGPLYYRTTFLVILPDDSPVWAWAQTKVQIGSNQM